MARGASTELCLGLLVIVSLTLTSAAYVPWKTAQINEKSNDLYSNVKRYSSSFRSNEDVLRYLKYFGQDMMIWRCKNAIQPYWSGKPIPLIELYCETIGLLTKVEWFHNGKKVELGGRFVETMVPHYANGQYFSSWVNFKLKIYNATQWDSGIYVFKATYDKNNREDEHLIYVDISERKKRKQPQGDYEDYGRLKKSGRKSSWKRGRYDASRRKERRRLRQLRRDRKLAKKKKIWEQGRKLAREPK